MEKEIWKPVINFETKYMVSNVGRVYSIKYDIIIAQRHLDNDPYLSVKISKYYKESVYRVHRLVAKAFIANPDNLPIVNHKDTIKTNNYSDNLEWTTPKGNMEHARKAGLFVDKLGEDRHTSKLKTTEVLEILNRLANGELANNISKDFNIGKDQISKIKHGIQWKHIDFDRSIFKRQIPLETVLILKSLVESGRSFLSLENEFNISRKKIKQIVNDIV